MVARRLTKGGAGCARTRPAQPPTRTSAHSCLLLRLPRVALSRSPERRIANRSKLDSHFVVEDCEILNIPVEYKATTAIFAGYVASTLIDHNRIVNTTYSGAPPRLALVALQNSRLESEVLGRQA